jgi:protein subunit release factor A|tara:strand:+ start:880 stop:1383 length:504 start_codon:yes stop_codon:yes gene_type:complete
VEELYEYDVIFEELEKSTVLTPENSVHINNDIFIQTQSLISEIKEKQEIRDRLNSLAYSIGWLKSATIIKDKAVVSKAINTVLKNKYSSINSIITELNSLKDKIDKLENVHTNLLKSGLSLDVKALLEEDFKEKHKKLNELHNKQKTILLNLSNIFVKLTKNSVLKK